jgi:hypothetical protein
MMKLKKLSTTHTSPSTLILLRYIILILLFAWVPIIIGCFLFYGPVWKFVSNSTSSPKLTLAPEVFGWNG